jgi:hypothetical protein
MENIPSSVINLGLGNYNTLIVLIIIILLLLGAYIYSIQLPSNFPPSGQIVLPLGTHPPIAKSAPDTSILFHLMNLYQMEQKISLAARSRIFV